MAEDNDAHIKWTMETGEGDNHRGSSDSKPATGSGKEGKGSVSFTTHDEEGRVGCASRAHLPCAEEMGLFRALACRQLPKMTCAVPVGSIPRGSGICDAFIATCAHLAAHTVGASRIRSEFACAAVS